jgi:Rrf2 family cysteine metabolism transcriptional repressor
LFTISAKGAYGLTAVIELAMNYNNGPMQIRDIAEAHNIPQHYLEQLLVILKNAGIVESYRGSRGGYALAKDPKQIKVVEVMNNLEGRLEVVPEQKKNGVLHFFWSKLEREIGEVLDISVEEIILEKQILDRSPMYNI